MAGPIAESVTETTNSGDFCGSLKSIGKLYKNKSNPYIQEVSLFGRLQYQTAYHDGSSFTGVDSDDTHTEFRRARLGLKVKAFNGLQLKANANLDHQAIRDQVFEEGWKTINQGFYDPNFHGVDWDELKNKYKPIALNASTDKDFRSIFN